MRRVRRTLAERLRARRATLGVAWVELAAEAGCSRGTLQAIAAERVGVGLDRVVRLGKALRCADASQLIDDREDPLDVSATTFFFIR